MSTSTAAYVSVFDRPATDEFEDRLLALPKGEVEFVAPVERFQCTRCDGMAEFAPYRATDCAFWGLAGLDGARSDTYGIYCPECA